MSLTVGQKLWFVNTQNRHAKPHEIIVTKVGRKWAETNARYRINIDDLRADAGAYSSPGIAYLSEQHYLDEQALKAAWGEFHTKVHRMYSPPKGMNIAAIEHLTRLIEADHNAA